MLILEKFLQMDVNDTASWHENFRVDVKDDFNYGFDVLDAIAEKSPDALALLYTNPQGAERRFTFDDMRRYSNQAANYFHSLGIRKGDAVLVILKRKYQYWFASMGLCKLGAIIIPATAQLSAKDIVYRCHSANVKMILCADDDSIIREAEAAIPSCPSLLCAALAGRSREGWLDFDAGLAALPDIFHRPSEGDALIATDPMLIYFTSGTTGHPKMVRHNFLYPLGHIATSWFWHQTRPGGLHFTISDTGWAKAAWGKLYGQWLSECAVFVYDFDRFQAKEILEKLQAYPISTFCAPPTMYRMMTQEVLSNYDLSALQHCCSAGEPLTPEVFNDWKLATGLPIREGFGQSETVCCIGMEPGMAVKPGSMGKPMPGFSILLADSDGNPCAPYVCGEICICVQEGFPYGLFTEYYRDEELTAKAWRGGVYHTGDMAYMDEEGYFWYVGRADDIIKSSGYRIGPFEVESALLEHPAVLEAAVTGVPDALRGQIVKATIVLKPGRHGSDLLMKELQNHVKTTTAPYKYPRIIQFVDELPKTVSGKIKRAQLRQEAFAK